jgi:hypothetical protein
MINKVRLALERKGYTVGEIDLLLKSFTQLLDKLTKEAVWKRFAYRCAIHRRS